MSWPQQVESDFTKTATVELDKIFRQKALKRWIAMVIHDSIWVECPEAEEREVRDIMEGVMTAVMRLSAPMIVDLETRALEKKPLI